MFKRISKTFAAIGFLILLFSVAAIIAGGIVFNRSLPSKMQYEEAHLLVESAEKKLRLEHEAVVLFEASRDTIHINVYGVVDAATQDDLIKHLRMVVERHPFDGKIYLNFFGARAFTSDDSLGEKQVGKWKQARVRRNPKFLRKIKLN